MKREELEVALLDEIAQDLVEDQVQPDEYYVKEEADKMMDAMEKDNKDLRHNLEDYKCENEALKQRINDLEFSYKEYTCENIAYSKRIKELESDLSTMKTSYEFLIKNAVNIAKDTELKLQNRIKDLESQIPKWISVKAVNNRPNEIGDYVLVCDYVNRTRGTAIYQDGKFTLTTCGIAELNITHWMPLLPSPATEET